MPMDQTAQIRQKTDIVQLISEFITLKKTGHNFHALCPFHGEKTPSFVVSPERQIWHCFGCGMGGDAYTFLMQYENLEFPEALRMLAKRAGIELQESFRNKAISSQKERLYSLNMLAAEFYHYLLTRHPIGKTALRYLIEERHIKPQVVDTFMIGFAPRNGNTLSQYLTQKKNYPPQDLIDAGLSIPRGRDLIDFFQGRLMFPLFDHRDNVVGFSGRALEGSTMSGKYINTRETVLYKKGNHFFGLNRAKESIKKEQAALVMEGEFDVISAFQEGITNAVAVKGSALTEEQVQLLMRFAPKVVLCFDTDKAGIEAIKRSVPTLERRGAAITVVVIPGGKDPDESIKTDPYAFKLAIKHDVNVYDFLITNAIAATAPTTIEAKKKITDEILPYLAAIENEIVKEHFLKKLSNELDVSFESLVKQTDKLKAKNTKPETIIPISKGKRPREEVLEEYLLALIVQSKDPFLSAEHAMEIIASLDFSIPAYQRLLEHVVTFGKGHHFEGKKFSDELPAELQHAYDTCYLLPLPDFKNDGMALEELEKVAQDIKKMKLKEKIKVLSDQIKKAESDNNQEQLAVLQQSFQQTLSSMKSE